MAGLAKVSPAPPLARASQEIIFHAALAISDPAKRNRFLERACQGDPLLQRKVAALLKAEAAADEFFEPDRSKYNPPTGPGSGAGLVLNPVGEGPGSVVGNFQLM